MLVEVDDDFLDDMVVVSLVQTYVRMKQDVKRGKAHPEDLEHWKQIIPALKVVLEYYSVPSQLEAKIKKAKQK
jgi:hypothetical protein